LIEAQDPLGGDQGLWFAVVQCDGCGICFTNPRPNTSSIGAFYREDYGPHLRAKAPRRRSRFARHRPEKEPVPWHGRGRLLDFGCGAGEYLALMQSCGWSVAGLDFSPSAAAIAQDRLGVTVHVGTLPHPELAAESFDVITMWHVLEHLHDPLAALRAARGILVPGGKIHIAVPNIDSWPFRWFGRSWFGLDLPRHLTHFTPMTLMQMLEKAGYRPDPARLVRHSDWLRVSAGRAAQKPDAAWWQRVIARKYVARAVSWVCHLAGNTDGLYVSATKL
jgi:2-polyprenyl-3-methyl-5-hydroxy-6-metoxy-1,4-benzoquinol methylase